MALGAQTGDLALRAVSCALRAPDAAPTFPPAAPAALPDYLTNRRSMMSASHLSRTRPIAAALFVAALVPAAAFAQPAALSGGSVLLGGQASFSVDSDSETDENATSLTLLPSVQYFVSPGLALGGTLRLTHTSEDDFSSTSYGAGPAISYYFVQDGGVHPFVRASVQALRFSSGVDTNESDTNIFGFGGAAGILFLLTDGVGIDAAFYYDRLEYGGDSDFNTSSLGLALGVSAFAF